ncbi:MAG: histidine kinase [Flavobacteriia bacterium]|nr:histidine kinase [Flavobacteriia bacterium]
MNGTKKVYWFAQISGWTTYAFISYLANYLDKGNLLHYSFMLMVISFSLSGLLLTHWMRHLMIRFQWLELPFSKLIPRLSVLILIIAFLLVNTEALIACLFENRSLTYLYKQFSSIPFYLNMLGAILLLILWNGIYFTYYFFNKAYLKEIDNLRLQSSQNEIELKNLKSQLNPHFLFNSLNSIRALIEFDPELAKKTVTQLSNLLRTSLVSGKKDTITIGEELEIVKNYLDLEKIRFEDRLRVTMQIQEGLEKLEIPPFILQMLAENAVKHGISKEINGGELEIQIVRDRETLYLYVKNTGKLRNEAADTGIGIENTKRRLALMYKEGASFRIYEEDGKVISEIIIKHVI